MMASKLVSAFLLALLWCGTAAQALDSILIDNFEGGLEPTWSPRMFHNETVYQVVADGSNQVLQATSNGSASGLIFEREFDVYAYPVLAWRWKVAGIIPGGDYRQKATDDFAARIYVTFPHWFFPKTTSLNYIWANRMPKGEIHPNAYTGNAMMIAVESGAEKAGEWLAARRNILADYRRAFGREPPRKAVIAIMTDTDNTRQQARAWYDDIYLSRE